MKNSILSVLAFTILASLNSCSDEPGINKKTNKILATLDIYDLGSFESTTRIWYFATDNSGNILDSKRWNNESVLTLQGDVLDDEKINVFIVTEYSNTGSDSPTIFAYTDVTPGRKDSMGSKNSTPPLDGSIIVTVKNLPNTSSFNVMSGFQGAHETIGHANRSGTDGIYELTPRNLTQKKIHFCYSEVNADPMYFETEVEWNGGSYTFDFKEKFKPYDNVINLPTDGHYNFNAPNGRVAGVNGTEVYWNSFYVDGFGQGDALRMGFNNGFEKYYSVVTVHHNERLYVWSQVTPSLGEENFIWPEHDFTVTNNSIADFNFTNDWGKNIVQRSTEYARVITIDGKVAVSFLTVVSAGDSGNLTLKEFPQDLVNTFTWIDDFDQYKYRSTTITFDDKGSAGYDPRTYYSITK